MKMQSERNPFNFKYPNNMDLFVRFPILKLFLDACSFESAAIIRGMRSLWKGKRILTICRLDMKKRNTPFSISFSISKRIRALRVSRILLRQYFLTLANARSAEVCITFVRRLSRSNDLTWGLLYSQLILARVSLLARCLLSSFSPWL